MTERDEATVDNDLSQAPTPIDTGNSGVGSDTQPAGEAEPAQAAGASSRARPEAASSDSSDGESTLGRDRASTVDPGGTALPGGKGASGQVVPPGASDPESGRATEDSLLPADQTRLYNAQWSDIQAHFVDQPRQSVEQADALVVDIMQRVTAGFSHERERLEAQWEQGADVSTEDLRVVLTRYRSFFDRLIST